MDTAIDPSMKYEESLKSLSISASAQISALEARYACRGIVKAVQTDADYQEKKENETSALEPLAYRLSALCDRRLDARYRDADGEMHEEQLLTYINDTRALRTRETDFAEAAPSDEAVYAQEAEKPCVAVIKGDGRESAGERIAKLPSTLPSLVASLPSKAIKTVRASYADWFNPQRADTKKNTHRFPVSAFAAILAVAMSLMLVVASSVLVNQGENRVNALKMELSDMGGEVAELKSDLEVKNDLLKLREVATREYGMVGEEFVRMDYLSIGEGDSIEVFEEEPEKTVGLGALLSAIGLK